MLLINKAVALWFHITSCTLTEPTNIKLWKRLVGASIQTDRNIIEVDCFPIDDYIMTIVSLQVARIVTE